MPAVLTQTYYYRSDSASSPYKFGKKLSALIYEYRLPSQPLVIICIGSDRSTGDSLGPLIGYKLSKRKLKDTHIYGTLKNPIHAINLEETLSYIEEVHANPFIIAIDASLGTPEHIGSITLSAQPLKPGIGVKKSLPEVGDISITGIVNFSGILDTMLLQSTRLSLVMNLADSISLGIIIGLL